MSKRKTKHKPGIHLVKRRVYIEEDKKHKTWYWWKIVSKNGRIIARSSETYSRKSGAVKSIRTALAIFTNYDAPSLAAVTYYDHTQEGEPLKSYL
jgi:uncharacterized protein YegP (UPF0339 family)